MVALPFLVRLLGIVGTLTMILVGGGLFVHHLPAVEHLFSGFPVLLAEGVVVGMLAVEVFAVARKSIDSFLCGWDG